MLIAYPVGLSDEVALHGVVTVRQVGQILCNTDSGDVATPSVPAATALSKVQTLVTASELTALVPALAGEVVAAAACGVSVLIFSYSRFDLMNQGF